MGVLVNTRYNYFPLFNRGDLAPLVLLFLLLLGSLFLCRHRVLLRVFNPRAHFDHGSSAIRVEAVSHS